MIDKLHERANTLSCTVVAPTRIDLAGGTLDIWPLAAILQEKYDLWNSPIKTVNVAIDLYARAEITLSKSDQFEWCFVDKDAETTETGIDLSGDHAKQFLLHRAVARFFKGRTSSLGFGHLKLASSAMAPRSSGLGGSSSLVVAMLVGMDALTRKNATKINMCRQARHLEAGVLGNLAGNQDHFAAMFGGVQSVTHGVEGSDTEPISCDGYDLLDNVVLAFSGQQHFSAFNNWLVLEKVLTGNKEILSRCAGIANIALALPEVLERNDWVEMARMMSEEWEMRRSLDSGISTPVLDKMFDSAKKAGAIGGKVCGAGGGGVLVTVLPDPDARHKVEKAIEAAGGKVLRAGYAPEGAKITLTAP